MGEASSGTTKRKQYYLKNISNGMGEASSGTTKRKQYYLKKVSNGMGPLLTFFR
jgi:hypothetical protein